MMDNGGGEEELEVSISNLIKCSIFRQLIITSSSMGGFLFCGSRKLTYFHSGKRKYSVYFNGFWTKNSDGNRNIIF